MHIEGLHHVSICVRDLDRAKSFYSDVLGLVELERPAFDFPGAWYTLGERQLHLIVNPAAETLRCAAPPSSREAHFALRVDDWEGAIAELRKHGVEVLESRANPTPWRQAYVTDPDGNVVELNEEREP